MGIYSEKPVCLLFGSLGIPVPTSPSFSSDVYVYMVCVHVFKYCVIECLHSINATAVILLEKISFGNGCGPLEHILVRQGIVAAMFKVHQ